MAGTGIDEPIAQATPDFPNAYICRDVFGWGVCGMPYIGCDCSKDSRFVVVYGHHMSEEMEFAEFVGFMIGSRRI